MIVSAGALIFFVLFLLYPLFGILKQSALDNESGELTLANFALFFSRKYYYNSLLNSLKVTSCVTLLATVLGTTLAFVMKTVKIRGRSFLDLVITLSMISPPFIGAYSWILLLGRNGALTRFLNDILGLHYQGIYGFGGILLVASLFMMPVIYLYVSGALSSMDTSLFEAAEGFGCTGFRRFTLVVIPLITPTIIAAALLAFMRSLADFGTPMLIGEGYRTMPVLIFNQYMAETGSDKNFAAAMSLILMLTTLAVFLAQKYVTDHNSYSMNAYQPIEPVKAGMLRSILAHLYCYTLIGLATIPQALIIYTAFKKTSPSGSMFVDGFSLDSFNRVFSRLGDSIRNTLVFSSAAVLIIIILGLLVSYVVVRRPSRLNTALDAFSMIPFIIPGSVLGIAISVSFRKPFVLAGTAGALILVYVIRRLPYMIRSISALLRSISMSTEEAGISLGASPLRVFTRITVPILGPGILSGSIMTWMQTTSELSASIMLYVAGTRTITVAIYTEVIRGMYGNAAALSVIFMGISVICLLVIFKITGRRELKL
ncbi:Fe3+ ABC transporter permease [Treponema primitia ZAS-2]|uniref:Fe3+ ABC transporter permease n=2 Tax=Treponema primitia TaxID=88058 RepID=F5YMR7_TREPZ|nr:Fe3+ ABC transporter permease [Treponema primitia ZAS-2]